MKIHKKLKRGNIYIENNELFIYINSQDKKYFGTITELKIKLNILYKLNGNRNINNF